MAENNDEHKFKHCWCKYLGLVLATIVGAFLAFYFLVDITIYHLLSPEYQLNKMEKMMDKDMPKIMNFKHIPTIIHFIEGDDEYKIIVNLKPFNNNSDNIKVDVNGQIITVSGTMEKNKKNEENIMSFSQSYELPEKFDEAKITKVKKHDKYIITIPTIED